MLTYIFVEMVSFVCLWSHNRLSSSSPGLLHRVAHILAVLVPQDAIILTIIFLVKFKRSVRAPRTLRMPELGEAMVAILDSPSPQKLNIFSWFFQNLLDIWPVLSKQHFPCCPSYLFHTMQQPWQGHYRCTVQIKATAAQEQCFKYGEITNIFLYKSLKSDIARIA